MLALMKVAEGRGAVELREVDPPRAGPGEVLIRVGAAGVCGTDLHIYEGRFACKPPVIMGHEFAGQIVEVGPGVTKFAPGDRVVAEPHRGGCGSCRYCLTGHVEICEEKKAIGYKVDGCFASLLSLPVGSLHRIPDHVSFDKAAVCEPLACVVRCMLERSRIEPEDFVVVLGCGPIGLLAAAVAKAEGARDVVITGTDRDALRLEAARNMGIGHAVNLQRENVPDLVKRLTNGAGADVVMEASGAEPAIRQAFDLLRRGGRVAALGIVGKDAVAVPWDLALRKAVDVHFSWSTAWTSWERAMSLIATGKVNLDPLITHVLPMNEWQRAFDLLQELKAIKVILNP